MTENFEKYAGLMQTNREKLERYTDEDWSLAAKWMIGEIEASGMSLEKMVIHEWDCECLDCYLDDMAVINDGTFEDGVW